MLYAEVMSDSAAPELRAEAFVRQPEALRTELERAGVFEFETYESGLHPASSLPPRLSLQTGMGMAWLRDNAQVIMARAEAGHYDAAEAGGRALLTILKQEEAVLDDVVSGRDTSRRLTVRVDGDTLKSDHEDRRQNDATGYALWAASRLICRGALVPKVDDFAILKQTARYLVRIGFWRDPDHGHWEEDMRLHASSIGAAVAGLRETGRMLRRRGAAADVEEDLKRGIGEGMARFNAIMRSGVTDWPTPEGAVMRTPGFSLQRRTHDAALLFMVRPLELLSGRTAASVVRGVRRELGREHGIARYSGDTYWGPDFPELVPIEARTTDAPGRLEARNARAASIAASRNEAQWTLFDPLIAEHASYSRHRRAELAHLNRSLAQLVPTEAGLRLPEAFYLDTKAEQWTPNTHTPLLWSQANLLRAVLAFERSRR